MNLSGPLIGNQAVASAEDMPESDQWSGPKRFTATRMVAPKKAEDAAKAEVKDDTEAT